MLVKYALSLDEKRQMIVSCLRAYCSEQNEVFMVRLLCKRVHSVVIGFLAQLKSKAALNLVS